MMSVLAILDSNGTIKRSYSGARVLRVHARRPAGPAFSSFSSNFSVRLTRGWRAAVCLLAAALALLLAFTPLAALAQEQNKVTATLVLTPATIDESGATNSSTVTATLDQAPGVATEIRVFANAVSPTQSSDFTLSTNDRLTFAANATTSTGNVTVTAVDNEMTHADRQVRVTAQATTNTDGVNAIAPVTLTITDDDEPTNNAPVFSSPPTSLNVDENSVGGTTVGTVAATDADTDDTLTYSLDSTSAAVFEISGSGVITVKSSADLNHEGTPSYSTTVTVNDGTVDVTHSLTINVTDKDEAPDAPAAPTVTGASTSSVTASWTAPDVTGKPALTDYDVRYFKGSTDPANAADWIEPGETSGHNHTGTNTMATITGLDQGSAYRVQVRATNAEGTSGWSASGGGSTNNNAPVFSSVTESRSVTENTTANTNVGAAIPAATDADNDSLTYSMAGDDAASFDFTTSTRQITTKSGVTYDHETKSSYEVTIKADDSNGGTATVTVTITVTDDDEPPAATGAPTVSASSSISLNVSWTAPDVTGKPPISDYDVRYKKSAATDWSDHAYNSTGTSTTITGLDVSTQYNVQVKAKNHEGESDWSVSGSGTTNAPPAVSSVTLVSTPTVDADGNSTNETYKVGDVVQARVTFTAAVDATGNPVLKLRLATGVERNMTTTATTNSTTLDFRYTVAAGDRSTQGIGFGANTLSAGTAIREAGTTTDANLDFTAVGHNANHKVDGVAPSLSSAAVKGATLTLAYGEALDENSVPAKSAFTVTVDGSTANLVTNNPVDVDGSTVTLTLASAVVHSDAVRVSYETPTSNPIQDVASNNAADLSTHTVTNNTPNRSPTFTNQPSEVSVEENSTVGAAVGTVTATDPDGDTVTHALDSASDALFDIDSSGNITVQSGADLNYEGTSSYTATVTATDSESATATHEVTINVTDADEPPDAPGAPTVSAAAGQTAPVSLNVSWTAPVVTGRPAIDDYDVQFKKSTASAWIDHAHTGTGTSTTIGSLADRLEPGTRYDVQVRAVNDEGEGLWSAIGNGTTAPPDTTPPSFSSATVDRTVLKVVFDENLHAGSKPPTGAFNVQLSGGRVTADAGLTIADATVTLTLSETVAPGATVTVAYTNNFSPSLRDPFDNEVKTFGAQPVTNNTPSRSDTTAPAVSSAMVKGKALSVTFNEDLDTGSLPAGSVFSLNAFYPDGDDEDEVKARGTGTVSISGRTVSVTLTRAVPAGGRLVLGYSKPSTSPLRDAAGNVVTTFIQSVPNNTPGARRSPAGATVTLSVAENAASVGTVAATDPDRDTLTYSLSGSHAEFFDIDVRTGQITVDSDTTLDFESTTSYSVTAQVTDGEDTDGVTEPSPGIDDTITVTIEVTDVNEPPPMPDAPAVNVVSTSSMEVSWTAPDVTGRPDIDGYDVQFKKSAAASWTDHPHDGTDVATTISELDANSTYEVRVRATNDEGEGAWSEAGNGETGNTPPVFTGQPATASVAENSTAGTPVVTVEATDTDNGDTLSYSLDSTSGVVFDIDSSGNITVRSGAVLDHETTPNITATVTATDNGSATATHEVTISVTDRPEPPTAPDSPTVSTASESSLEVSWTAPNTTGRPAITDYNVRYRESGAADWINHVHTGSGTTTTIGELTAGTTYEVQVQAANVEGLGAWSEAGNGTTNTPDNTAPVFTDQPATASVAEDSAAGTAVVTVEATDADAGDTLSYSLDSTSGAVFDIDSSGNITVRSGAALDHETTPSITATVTATDSQSVSTTHEVTISVTDVAEPPDAPDAPAVARASSTSVDVSWTAPDATGRPAVTDYDVRYVAGASDPASESDWIEPGEAGGHDHTGPDTSATITGLSPNTAYRVQVRAANDEGVGTWSGSGTTDGDTDVAPTVPSFDLGATTRFSIAENHEDGAIVGTVAATDADGDTLTYSLAGADATTFTIDASTGRITVTPGVTLDRETKARYEVTAQVTDGEDTDGTIEETPTIDATITVTIDVTVTATNNPPVFATTTVTRTVTENTAANGNVGAVVTAADADGDTLSYSLGGTDAASFAIDANTGQITVGSGTTLNFEAKSSYEVTVTAADGNGGSASATVTINVTAVTEPTTPTTPTAPSAPAAPTVTDASSTSLSVRWTAPDVTGQPPITGYDVQYKQSSATSWTDHTHTGTDTTTTITGLEVDTRYDVRVRAENRVSPGPWSAAGSNTTDRRLRVTITNTAAKEGAVLQFTVRITPAPQNAVPLTWATQDGTATAPADYTAAQGTVTIPAGGTTVTFEVVTREDDAPEANETFQVRIQLRGMPAATTLATGTIENDDPLTLPPTPGTTTRTLPPPPGTTQPLQVTQTRAPATPGTVELPEPERVTENVMVTLMPVAATVPLTSARYELGPASAQTLVDLDVRPVPPGGVKLCLPVSADLRAEAQGRPLTLLHYAAGTWTAVAGTQDDGAQLCATGVTSFSPFAVGYDQQYPAQRAAVRRLFGVLGGQIVEGAVTTIGSRFTARPPAAATMTLGGQRFAWTDLTASPAPDRATARCPEVGAPGAFEPGCTLTEPRQNPGQTVDLGRLLWGSSFELPLGAAATDDDGTPIPNARQWTLWGRGALSAFQGQGPSDGRFSGDLKTAYLGLDARTSQWVAGLAVGHGRSDADYTTLGPATGGGGSVTTTLTAVHPYGRWTLPGGREAWTLLGAGWGEATRETPAQAATPPTTERSDLTLWMAAGGLRQALSPLGGVDLTLRADGSMARLATGDGPQTLDGLTADNWRGRLGLEGATQWTVGTTGLLRPFAEVVGRYDGGDGVIGTGLEVAGGLQYQAPRVALEVRGRWLAVHSAAGYQERGVSVTARVQPGAQGTGLSLALAPRWGAATGEATTLWRQALPQRAGAPGANTAALDAQLGYGVALATGVLTPFAQAGLVDGASRRLLVGTRFTLARTALALELAGTRQVHARTAPVHGVRLDLNFRF